MANYDEFNFLGPYEILEAAALNQNGADIAAKNSVALAELINEVDPLKNADGDRFLIRISNDKKETSSTRDLIINFVTKGFLKNNKVFKMEDMCLLPNKLLNTAAQKKSQYHSKSKFPMIGFEDRPLKQLPELRGDPCSERSSEVVVLDHGVRINQLKKIRDAKKLKLKEPESDHPSNLEIHELTYTPEKPRNQQHMLNRSMEQSFHTPPNPSLFVDIEEFNSGIHDYMNFKGCDTQLLDTVRSLVSDKMSRSSAQDFNNVFETQFEGA